MDQRTPSGVSDLYAVLDFETTGLNPNRGDRAIEIGIALLSGDKQIDTYSSLINPGFPVSSFITSFTGITNAMLAAAPTVQQVLPDVLEFIGDAQLVAHNASFDKKFWRHELRQSLGVKDNRDFVCTLMLSRRIFQAFASHKLGNIALELSIAAPNSHRALGDAQVTAQVLTTMQHRLRKAHPDDIVDRKFLHTYQKKSRSSLPDLTSES